MLPCYFDTKAVYGCDYNYKFNYLPINRMVKRGQNSSI